MILHDLRKNRTAILPDSGRDLLRSEVSLALGRLGFTVLRPRPEDLADEKHEHYLPRLIEKKPELFFSINLQGLFPGAPHTRSLLEAGIPTLAWFVDNPWHLLSAMRDPSWKNLHLALTDKSFVEPLQAAGAGSVMHMPLAASAAHMREAGNAPEKLGGIVFAGRSSFPNLESFFAGQELPEESMSRALEVQKHGERADFAWWVRELGLSESQKHFWPGKKARKPGKGAVLCNAAWRRACLQAAQTYAGGLSVFGDDGWQGLKDLRGPVDYYTRLPAAYRAARYSLNINSLLLPQGLSQRVFDAWMAGGFCLSDWNQGLEIFPPELVREIAFHSPEEIPSLAASLDANHNRREKLRRDWEAHILAEHSYEKRVGDTLFQLGLL